MLDRKFKDFEGRLGKKFERSLLNVNVDMHDAFKPVMSAVTNEIHDGISNYTEVVKRNVEHQFDDQRAEIAVIFDEFQTGKHFL